MALASRHAAGSVLLHLVMGLLMLAGLLKFVDLSEFDAALSTWTVVPLPLRPMIVVLVPASEVLIPGFWLAGVGRGRAVAAAALLLIAVSVTYTLQLSLGGRPTCGCLGGFAASQVARGSSDFVLLRNGGMLLCLLVGLALSGRTRPRRKVPALRPGRAAGFSLLESLLIVALTATLVATLLPSLSGLRTDIRCSRSLATARSHGAVFALYCNDYRGFWPYVTDPQSHYTILRASDAVVPVVYFQAVNRWNVALADPYFSGMAVHEVFSFPGRTPTTFTIFNYSQAMLADPIYWNESTRAGPTQWRATSEHEVLFPGLKALFVDSHSERVRRPDLHKVGGSPIGTVFCDNSARSVKIHDFLPGYRQFTGWGWHGTYNSVLSRGMHTIDGVRGRDVR